MIEGSTKNKIKVNKIIILLVALILVCVGTVFGIFALKNPQKKPEGSTWKIVVSYQAESEKLSFKKISLENKQIVPDSRGAKYSPYTLSLLGEKGGKLYTSKVVISTGYTFNIFMGSDSTSSAAAPSLPVAPKNIDSVLYAPYIAGSKEISITNNGKTELKVQLPQVKGVSSSQRIAESTCRKVQTVFISDGYTDFNQFHQDAAHLEQVFRSTAPYSQNPDMFDFQTLDHPSSFGCTQSIACVNNQVIQQVGYSAFPEASKFIVIANSSYVNPPPGTAIGVINSIGGNVAVFPRSVVVQGRQLVDETAVHEFLGHGVGLLYDRYVLKSGNRNVSRNCSRSPNGESFWPAAGVNQVYQGCYAAQYFAPAPNNCTVENHPILENGGSSRSAMSAAGCGGQVFDETEKYWIENYILPQYACTDPTDSPVSTNTPILTQPPTVTVTPTPSSTTCDPYNGGGATKLNVQDLVLVRQEAAKILTTNKGSCITSPSTNPTSVLDVVKLRRVLAGLESL